MVILTWGETLQARCNQVPTDPAKLLRSLL